MNDTLKIPIRNRIPMTRIKIRIARIIYRILHLVLREDQRIICRKNVRYAVDLSEGIDLSIFLFGNFQNHVTRQKYFSVPEDAVIFDVGANIGSMALKFAQLAPEGHVYAFEPTYFAYHKLQRNMALNPQLEKRVTTAQLFLSDHSQSDHRLQAYASWKVDGRIGQRHLLHGGAIKRAGSIPAVSLDDFCKNQEIKRLDLIKIDTDGHELHILKGARQTIESFIPVIVFELGAYTLKERNEEFQDYLDFFSDLNYTLLNSKNGKKITAENVHAQIPRLATTDVIAMASNGRQRG
jgi:FkbM family methyltransferase